MAITLTGPAWPSVAALRAALADAPETGTFAAGGRKLAATEQLRRFQSNGLQVPEWTRDWATARQWLRSGVTVFGRRENHSQGRDITIITHDAIRPRVAREWWCKFVPSTSEWRIHVFDGRVIARGCKIFTGPTPPGPPPLAVRSRSRGWTMRHDLEPSDALRDAARGSVSALGYLYGAVDLLVTPGGPVVLEVNRLPAMDDYTRAAYVRAIRRYVGGTKSTKASKSKGVTAPRRPRTSTRTSYEGFEID